MNTRSAFARAVSALSSVFVLLISQAALAGGGDYITTFPTGNAAADLAARVQALGGTITFSHSAAGIAIVHGLNDTTAAQLAASAGIQDVVADTSFSVNDAQDQIVGALHVPQVLQSNATSSISSASNPTTAYFYGLGFEWNMQAIHADGAWAQGQLGSPNVTVAVIDTGIDYRALDLAGLVDLQRSVSFVPTDDALAATLFPGVDPSTDLYGHGTVVATQISSNAVAVAGVTTRTRLMSVKVADVHGNAFVSAVLAGVLYAADHGADVANISIGGPTDKSASDDRRLVSSVQAVFSYAKRKGMLIVVGAANDSTNLDHNGNVFQVYCDAVHVVCVSATGPLTPGGWPYEPAVYTNYGRSAITVAAPGGNYGPLSQWPWGPSYGSVVWGLCSTTTVLVDNAGNPISTPCISGLLALGNVGTSLATPHVTGLAALLLAEYGKMAPSQLTSLLLKCTVDLGQPGVDPYYGKGHIDLASCPQ